MRSLLLAASFPPALGGVETLLYETSRRLAQPPLVVAPWPAAAPDMTVTAVRLNDATRAAYRPLWRLHPALHYTQAYLAPALQAARRAKPDVIQAGHVYFAPLARLLSVRLGAPYVVYAYGQEVWRAGRSVGMQVLDAQLRGGSMKAADRVLVPGTFTAGLLRDWDVAPGKLVCIPYGAEPRPPVEPPSGSALLTVARLVPRKGIDMVIRALTRLPDDVTFRVVGSGPDLDRLRQLAKNLRVSNRVAFLGRVEQAQLDDEYRRATLFVLPARRTADGELEGYGLVYFEAAAWGRPVIAGRSGGEIDAVIDGETGLLVDGTSETAVAEAIGRLLRDRAQLTRLGANGRRRVETSHNWARAAGVVDAALSQLR